MEPGNGLTTALDYDQARGYITSILTGQSTGTEVQSLSYTWDAVGNLTSRADQNQNGAKQTFTYDALYRLTRSSGSGTAQTIAYDTVGNITSKTGVGSYTYGDKPHAVTQTSGTRNASYSCDINSNMQASRMVIPPFLTRAKSGAKRPLRAFAWG